MVYPMIGITTYQAKNYLGYPIFALLRAYVDVLVKANCLPVLIPANLTGQTIPALYKHLDGILFTGGGDIGLNYFDGVPNPRVDGVDPERDLFEFSLLSKFVGGRKPFLGICRGLQVIVVGLGGTLYTHIDDQVPGAQKHDYYPDFPRTYLAHKVKVDSGTHLANILGETNLSVNSMHHQGAKDIPSRLKVAAVAPDGMIEAIELPDHPFGIAVQWHPEWLIDQPATQKLFRAFVDAANNLK